MTSRVAQFFPRRLIALLIISISVLIGFGQTGNSESTPGAADFECVQGNGAPAKGDPSQKKVRLFILSGQSNMAGLNPNVSFTPAVKKAFPNDEVIVVKDARGGQPIRRWLKTWRPPEGMSVKDKAPYGNLYDRLMTKVRAAIKNKKVATVSFVWMQGERDAREKFSAVYAKSLEALIKNLRDDLKHPQMTVVIGRLSDWNKGVTHWDAVCAAQMQVAKADSRADWVDTDELNGPKNGLHYTKDGYAELGRRFADKTIALLQKSQAPK